MRFLSAFALWAGWRKPRATDIPNTRPITPRPEWRGWWDELVVALRLAGRKPRVTDFNAVKWYVAPSIPTSLMNGVLRPLNGVLYDPKTCFGGIALFGDCSITLIESCVEYPTIVRHEMTHIIRFEGGHEAEWFHPRFGNYTGPQPEQL